MFQFDPTAYIPALLVVVLLAFVAVFVYMRDPLNVGPHPVTRSVWCARHKRRVMVEFTERVQTGMMLRRVRHCPVRRQGERCGEGCVQAVEDLRALQS